MRKQSGEARRLDILETTCEVVIERGFAGTRITDVADRLQVSKSLIHYHFDSKEALLAAAFEHYARKDLAEMVGDIEAAPTNADRIVRLLGNYVPEGSDDVEWKLWIDAWGEALRNPLMKRISQQLDEQSVALLEDLIRAGNDAGEFACPDPWASALRITALIDGLAVQYAAHEGLLDRHALLQSVLGLASAEIGAELARNEDLEGPTPGAHPHEGPRVRWCPACGSGHICAHSRD